VGLQACKNAGDAVAERVILVCVWDFVEVDGDTAREVPADLVAGADELDAVETGLVAEVELHPGASAIHQVDELLAAFDAELGEDR
jgi:hypothetical protein